MGDYMSIFNELEKMSCMDLALLDKAMSLLYLVGSEPGVDVSIKEKIRLLEEEVSLYRNRDERFNNSSVSIDLNRWEMISRH